MPPLACADWNVSSHTSFNDRTHKIDVQDTYYVDYTISIGTRYIAQGVFGLSNIILTLIDENNIVLGNVTRPTMSWTSSNQNTYLINSAHNIRYGYAILTCSFFGFKILQNDILVRDFIPCINPNNVVGMYDIVNGVFYSSPNGTAFVAGPVV